MNAQITREIPSLAQQAPAAEALMGLAQMAGDLPAAYIVIHASMPVHIAVQLDTPAQFEAWRTALQVPAESVEMLAEPSADMVWLATDMVVRGVAVRLTGHGVALSPETAEILPSVTAEVTA
ncbi:hypothetical protein ACFRCI_09610 [Streptomyces sp. NPDC056638]|uniref:hypothetical protein n=1 Tax=Streptomyces sp. NPDC056638 TaxID=3345887 RepID=UPI0036B8114A